MTRNENGMEKQNLSQQTAQRLYQLITAEKRFVPGEKLPNELELSQEMGVSRATLRQAIQSLAAQGLLEVRRGRGTFVSARAGDTDLGFSALERVRGQLRDLFELRSIFEPQAAALACRRASPEELAEILRRGGEVEACIQSGRDRTQADRAFHTAIVAAAHNEFMARLLPIIDQAVETAITSSGEHREQLAQATLRDHAVLLDFLRQRDAEGAQHAMAIHMRHAMAEMGLAPE